MALGLRRARRGPAIAGVVRADSILVRLGLVLVRLVDRGVHATTAVLVDFRADAMALLTCGCVDAFD